MPMWTNTTRPNFDFLSDSRHSLRNVIATSAGWVYRQQYTDTHGNLRTKDEVLVSIPQLAGSGKQGFPKIVEVYTANTTGGTTLNQDEVNHLYVVWNEPLTFANGAARFTLTIANTAGGNSVVATSNNDIASIVNANNTLVFNWYANTAGTYKVQAQTLSNTANAYLHSLNSGLENANLVITAAVSNAYSTFTVN